MGAKGQVSIPTEKLRDALRDRRWSEEELAWVLDLPVELAEHLVWELHITPTLALRLEAALEISAREWFAAEAMSVPDLWLLQEQMGGELAGIRRRRHLLNHDRRQQDGWVPGM
jgi:plasmid maintenance system antidote protein VapI